MKKLRLFLRNIPRKTKITGNLFLCLLLAFWIWLLIGSPAGITAIYRRAERANLVGPANILAITAEPELGYASVVLAEDGNFVMVYVRDEEDDRRTQFVYRERTRGMALLSAPAGGRRQESLPEIPVYLFDGYADAQKAELILSLPDGSQTSAAMTARREHDGFFRFALTDKKGVLQEVIRRLLLLSENTMADTRAHSLQAEIRLYDGNDVLVAECMLILDGK